MVAKQRRWVLWVFVLLVSLIVLSVFRNLLLDDTIPVLRLPGSVWQSTSTTYQNLLSIKYEDLDALIVQQNKTGMISPWESLHHPTKIQNYPYNSVEHDKINNTDPYREEFTIILLTHQKRKSELPKTVEHLIGLSRLQRVIIIWNGEKCSEEIQLPKTPFPVHVLTNGRNSLNNRFLPLGIIETDAILSMDDDMFPTHDSIIFAFRIWQDFRERIVGFPGRGVVWTSKGWRYDTAPCSVSLVLTGLAFIHKKYLALYTHEMSPVIRDRIDNVTNCEDIAMNFLVSHVTQKSPIKVTNLNQWVCKGCDAAETGKDALWKDTKHFDERDACINYFSEIYGYTPLFKSEYRFDDLYENRVQCVRLNKNHPTTPYSSLAFICLILGFILLFVHYSILPYLRRLHHHKHSRK